jgi:broad-specificity NMP kinase
VGFRAINMGASLKKELGLRGWQYVKIQYNAEANMISFTPCNEYEGYKVTQHGSITAQITKLMPEGRYVCYNGADKNELLFNYIG